MTEKLRVEFPPARMTKELAAYYIGVSEREFDDLRRVNEITTYGTGKRVYFLKTELDKFVENTPERVL